MISVGASQTDEKTIEVPKGLKCPNRKKAYVADQIFHKSKFGSFSITQNGNRITVKRIDGPTGWRTGIGFHCCTVREGSGIEISNIFYPLS